LTDRLARRQAMIYIQRREDMGNIDFNNVLWFIVRLLGFILAIGITGAVIYWLRTKLVSFLSEFIPNIKLVNQGSTLVMILLGLEGARCALNYIDQAQLNILFGGLVNLAIGLMGVIQWAVYIAVLFFIAYNIKDLIPRSNDANR
jgi:hypothetical protein